MGFDPPALPLLSTPSKCPCPRKSPRFSGPPGPCIPLSQALALDLVCVLSSPPTFTEERSQSSTLLTWSPTFSTTATTKSSTTSSPRMLENPRTSLPPRSSKFFHLYNMPQHGEGPAPPYQ